MDTEVTEETKVEEIKLPQLKKKKKTQIRSFWSLKKLLLPRWYACVL